LAKLESNDNDKSLENDNRKLKNYLELAGIEIEGENYQQAYIYYNKALEIDATAIIAWLGRGFSAGMKTTAFKNLPQKEIYLCLEKQAFVGQVDPKIQLALMQHIATNNPSVFDQYVHIYITLEEHVGNLLDSFVCNNRTDFFSLTEWRCHILRWLCLIYKSESLVGEFTLCFNVHKYYMKDIFLVVYLSLGPMWNNNPIHSYGNNEHDNMGDPNYERQIWIRHLRESFEMAGLTDDEFYSTKLNELKLIE